VGTKRGRRHLGLEAHGRVQPDSTAILWRPDHRRNSEFPGLLASDAAGERIRRDTADCHNDALGTDSTLAVPVAAATGPR